MPTPPVTVIATAAPPPVSSGEKEPTEMGLHDQTQAIELNEAQCADFAQMRAVLRLTFRAGVTRELAWRKHQLRQLIALFTENTDAIVAAVHADLGGPKFRGIFECGAVAQAKLALKNLDVWARD